MGTNQPSWNTHNNNTRSTGKTAASSHPFHTGIPDEFEKPSRSYNTVPHNSGLHINDIWHPLLQKTHHQALLHPGPQPTQHQVTSLTSATNTQVIHTPVIQSSSHSLEDGQQTDRNIEAPSQPQQFFSELPHGATTWCYRKLHLIIWRHHGKLPKLFSQSWFFRKREMQPWNYSLKGARQFCLRHFTKNQGTKAIMEIFKGHEGNVKKSPRAPRKFWKMLIIIKKQWKNKPTQRMSISHWLTHVSFICPCLGSITVYVTKTHYLCNICF